MSARNNQSGFSGMEPFGGVAAKPEPQQNGIIRFFGLFRLINSALNGFMQFIAVDMFAKFKKIQVNSMLALRRTVAEFTKKNIASDDFKVHLINSLLYLSVLPVSLFYLCNFLISSNV